MFSSWLSSCFVDVPPFVLSMLHTLLPAWLLFGHCGDCRERPCWNVSCSLACSRVVWVDGLRLDRFPVCMFGLAGSAVSSVSCSGVLCRLFACGSGWCLAAVWLFGYMHSVYLVSSISFHQKWISDWIRVLVENYFFFLFYFRSYESVSFFGFAVCLAESKWHTST